MALSLLINRRHMDIPDINRLAVGICMRFKLRHHLILGIAAMLDIDGIVDRFSIPVRCVLIVVISDRVFPNAGHRSKLLPGDPKLTHLP